MRHSPHSSFFSSLKQVEKRLASEISSNNTATINRENPEQSLPLSNTSFGFSSSIHLNYHQSTNLTLQESDPPQEFLSHSPDFNPSQEKGSQVVSVKDDRQIIGDTAGDEFQQLCELLNLAEVGFCEKKVGDDGQGTGEEQEGGCCCCFHGGFCSKISRVKGVNREKELRRLEGWIRYFSVEKKEPLRLAHLLLARAASMENSSAGIKFPVTVEQFLNEDPPP